MSQVSDEGLKAKIRECAVLAKTSHPNNQELRAQKFVAFLSGTLGASDAPLGDFIYDTILFADMAGSPK